MSDVAVVNLFDAPNTVFDIASLNTVVRACNLSAGENLSQAISLYVPWSKQGVNNFGVGTDILSIVACPTLLWVEFIAANQ